ncbi:hypothetical protein Acsp02_42700 [Actinoplanes sp. NBRC 103695]|nr:hypothetical protein Acsp02_42700 [Actinoplanes sp. NBRC 103695]
MPDDAVHQEKRRLARNMIDDAVARGRTPPLIVADAGYGDAAEFRQALEDRAMTYVVGVTGKHTAFTIDAQRTAPPYQGAGRRPPKIHREAAPTLKTLVMAAGRSAARRVGWRPDPAAEAAGSR